MQNCCTLCNSPLPVQQKFSVRYSFLIPGHLKMLGKNRNSIALSIFSRGVPKKKKKKKTRIVNTILSSAHKTIDNP